VDKQATVITLVLMEKNARGVSLVAGDTTGKETYVFDRANVSYSIATTSGLLLQDELLDQMY
jgi:hypothetical protein